MNTFLHYWRKTMTQKLSDRKHIQKIILIQVNSNKNIQIVAVPQMGIITKLKPTMISSLTVEDVAV